MSDLQVFFLLLTIFEGRGLLASKIKQSQYTIIYKSEVD